MTNICIMKYNNYFNRVIKQRFGALGQYFSKINSEKGSDPRAWYQVYTNLNFYSIDGVAAEQLITAADEDQLETLNLSNYLVEYDDDNNIITRWFIIDKTRVRNNQYKLTLKRDSITDNFDSVLNATGFIYKGNASKGNPLFYNNEGNTVNQIKQSEVLLKDKTQVPWVVGYLDENIGNDKFTGTVRNAHFDYIGWGPFQGYVTGVGTYNNIVLGPSFNAKFRIRNRYVIGFDDFIDEYNYYTNSVTRTEDDFSGNYTFLVAEELHTFNGNLFNANDFINEIMTDSENVINVESLATKICYVSGNYYKVTPVLAQAKSGSKTDTFSVEAEYMADNVFGNIVKAYGYKSYPGSYPATNTFQVDYEYNVYTLVVEQISTSTIEESYDIFVNNIKQDTPTCIDAPYKMFCMPYCNISQIKDSSGSQIFGSIDKETALAQVIALSGGLGSHLYDLQILPYCPIASKISNINYTSSTNTISFRYKGNVQQIWKDNTTEALLMGVLLFADRASFEPEIVNPPKVSYYGWNDIDVKVANECSMVRLTSPNYSGVFEFNPAKNNGYVKFLVDCTYKPYSPHIHVVPSFRNLYGQNFNDATGLICSGDFSLPRITDQWAEYEINNKNYQMQFNREIESMELQQNWSVAESVVNMVGGSAAKGIASGAMTNPLAGVGIAATSAGEGVLNLIEQVSLGNDKINAAKDQFKMNLENIQARPYGLTNVGVLNKDFKFFPFVETYDATDKEKEAIKNKIIYSGINLGVIGKIDDYLGYASKNEMTQYIQANIIDIDIEDDYHLANDVNNELMRGVRIYGI